MVDDRYTLKRWIPEFRSHADECEFRRARLDTDRVSSLLFLTMLGLLFLWGHTSDLRNFGGGNGEIEILLLRLLPIFFIAIVAVPIWRAKQPGMITAGIATAFIAVCGAYWQLVCIPGHTAATPS